ncbi:hypothetical protein O181_013130 [Austropuccinia psidii MF-1]|uniref:Uncharacterized protein n=1 Tax=Austropuccinia psidii MF-1 TaxID=1389203 RepID=A0A9Q3BZ91_9BASI|nr:hypothetical protein [Austropuccinia psidii MF-1]
MEAAIQSRQMYLDMEEARPGPDQASQPQERHFWKIPEFPSISQEGQKDKELVEEQKSFIHRPEEIVGNDPRFGEKRPSGVYQLQTSSRNVQIQAQKTPEVAERSQEPSGQQQRQSQLAKSLPTRVQDPQIVTFSSGKCFQYGQNSYGIYSQGSGKDEEDYLLNLVFI